MLLRASPVQQAAHMLRFSEVRKNNVKARSPLLLRLRALRIYCIYVQYANGVSAKFESQCRYLSTCFSLGPGKVRCVTS